MPAEAYVFGNAIGRRVKSVREAWNNAATKAGLTDFQIRDLRHEAGSRFDEAGMPINYVSNMLGHSNLSTTSRYLNAPPRSPPSNSDFRCDILRIPAFGSHHLRKWRNGRRASLRS